MIPCRLLPETRQRIEEYAEELRKAAPSIGGHGLSEEEFEQSGIFRSAIEIIRGQQSATTVRKREFVEEILEVLRKGRAVSEWRFVGARERHDYEVLMPNGRMSVVETKGCLDGNNTNIFQRPPHADEFIIWSLCQNPGADPVRNAWSGIVTRLSAEIIHRKQIVDGLIIWDMVCGTLGRPCPKVLEDRRRSTLLPSGSRVPPPCVYVLPRTIPDPRNNPNPRPGVLRDVALMAAILKGFGGLKSDVTEVGFEVRQNGADTQRKISFHRGGQVIPGSGWITVRRAAR
ncbi:MAG: hypothetical protein HUU16_07955 [Candidatus Omnitrophica bacterium]|nr:hypothetical protein [Candidatus Omnitrophota bacterium]